VGRLIIANAMVLLLLLTVFTSPALQARLAFDPAHLWPGRGRSSLTCSCTVGSSTCSATC
jgi:hypothetical protein